MTGVTREGFNFLAIQETQTNNIPDKVFKSYWGNSIFESEVVEPRGRSGRIVSLWDPGVFKKIDSVKENNFLLIKGRIKGCEEDAYVVNVYAPQKVKEKSELWEKIMRLKLNSPGKWFIIGDFNVVRVAEERKGSRFNHQSAREFNSFIYSADLHEYMMKGGYFTYMIRDEKGTKLSKTDRLLVCRGVLDSWPSACFRALPRKLSDHNPILLSVKDINFGPKPFRIFSSWLEKEGFEEFVKEAKESFNFHGLPDVKLMLLFRHIRSHVKRWRDKTLEKEGEELGNCVLKLEELDAMLENKELSEEEEWTRIECKKRINEIEYRKEKDIRQRSRCRWAIDGDENTKFFHGLINNRKVSNMIQGLQVGDEWESNPKKIKKQVHDFFRNKFKETWEMRPELQCFFESRLEEEESKTLEEKFTAEEIKKAVFDWSTIGLPGPMG
uniref:uncharacterized protein LOC122591944 n=1 Tax=Erigeron canadensis TaxID=72917 RepID=UPI001CB9B080|nr:uncharacterized protein LOC122591944 [Erigeron canadensis]